MSVLAKLGSCLLIAGCLGPATLACSQNPTPDSVPTISPVAAIRSAISNQDGYRKLQQRRLCTYIRNVRSNYGTGQSLTHRVVADEVLFDLGSRDAEQPAEGQPHTALAEAFDLWNHPLFQAILKNSVFQRTRESTEWDGRKSQIYQFSPSPNFQPSDDTERIAQAVYGTVSIDETTQVFDGLHGLAMQDVYEGGRLLLLGPHADGPIPLFAYIAGPADGVIVPKLWDEANFTPVKRGKDQSAEWLGTLSRTFIRLNACQDFKVESTIRPGFAVVEPSPNPKP